MSFALDASGDGGKWTKDEGMPISIGRKATSRKAECHAGKSDGDRSYHIRLATSSLAGERELPRGIRQGVRNVFSHAKL